MNRRLATFALILLSLADVSRGYGQSAHAATAQPRGWQRDHQLQLASPSAPQLHARHDTWYEFLLKQFNPSDYDYGRSMEERRQTFLDASVRNPYFRYSAAITLALLIATTLCTKFWIDHRRAMWVTAEMMTDLYNHDAYSRRLAREAIDRYNEHIERCNRAIEATEDGVSSLAMDSELESLRSELRSVCGERDSYKRERDLAKNELAEKERLLTDLSLRLDAIAKKSDASRSVSNPVDVRSADEKLVQHINNLQEQLYTERRENKRLKGA